METSLPTAIAPPPPSWRAIYKAAWKKNAFLGLKRGRFISAPFNATLQMSFTVMMYFIFEGVVQDGGSKSVQRWLMASFMPLNTLIGITVGMNGALIDIIGEKHQKMKIIQNIYGMSETTYWTSWFTFYGIIAFLCMCIIYIFWYAIIPVLHTVNFAISFIILASAYAQILLLVFCCSLFIEKPRVADAISSMASILAISLASLSQFLLRDHQWLGYISGCFPFMNCFQALASMLYLSAAMECDDAGCKDVGASFETLHLTEFCMVEHHPIHFPCIEEAKAKIFPLQTALIFLIVDTLVLAFLLWWLGQTWQGAYGKAKPWYFCLMPNYMCKSRNFHSSIAPGMSPSEPQPALSIRHLRKVFRDGKVAVDDLSLEIFPGEIFAVLGHNGAGKTTALNCIVGLTPTTSGEIFINGYNVETDLELARQQLSVCPQDNPMFEEFTVKQHLAYFSLLRGVPPESVERCMTSILSALGLSDRAGHPCGKLSGGQKRRLWVATALIGDSPVSFLDEPTSGMDPSSRRELWSLLLKIRDTGRCIIFTTHYLEEADILANRKAVLAHGRVQAVGTSRDLKQRFGIGYRLTMQIQTSTNRQRLESFAKEYVKSAILEDEEEASVASITMNLDDVSHFSKLLVALEESQDELGVTDYALGMSSLEDVFMALGQAKVKDDTVESKDIQDLEAQTETTTAERSEIMKIKSSDWHCAKAVFVLRLKPIVTSKMRLATILILPICIQLGGTFLANLGASNSDGGVNGYAIALYPALSFGFSLISSAQDLMTDIKKKCKYVSVSQGLSAKSYWLGNFLAHIVLLLPTAVEFVIIFLILRPPSIPLESLLVVIPTILLYPIPLTLCVYNFTAAMAGSESISKIVPVMLIATQMLPAMITWLVTANFVTGLEDFAIAWHIALSVINPNYALPGMMSYLVNVDGPRQLSVGGYFGCLSVLPVYTMLVTSCFCLLNLVRLDTKSYRNKAPAPTEAARPIADEDVLAEEVRCREEPDGNDAARYQELSHTYRFANTGARPTACAHATREFKYVNAVKSISLGIQKGECFSLLGPNGAGKTTTLGILTGEIRNPSAGKVSIFGHNMSMESERVKAFDILGVCPQVDPLWDDISGKDHLRFYGRIKGISEIELDKTVMNLLDRLGLSVEDAGKPVSTYSGGMKRKLSVGIALIGNSKMLFLDEPSAAVDAGAKRHLWKVIKARAPDQTVVLTTHSMEEAGALSSRMAIQVMGQLRCLGTPMHIKHKYGAGYQLELFVAHGASVGDGFAKKEDELLSFVQENISPLAELLEGQAERQLFQLPPRSEGFKLAKVLEVVEMLKGSLGVTEYTISQPSLEQVFLRFAKEQHEADRAAEIAESEKPMKPVEKE